MKNIFYILIASLILNFTFEENPNKIISKQNVKSLNNSIINKENKINENSKTVKVDGKNIIINNQNVIKIPEKFLNKLIKQQNNVKESNNDNKPSKKNNKLGKKLCLPDVEEKCMLHCKEKNILKFSCIYNSKEIASHSKDYIYKKNVCICGELKYLQKTNDIDYSKEDKNIEIKSPNANFVETNYIPLNVLNDSNQILMLDNKLLNI